MAEESKGIALAILGIVAVIAIIGLVLMFSKMKATGQVYGGGLTWGEGGWQSEGLATRYLYTPETQIPGAIVRATGSGKLGAEPATTQYRKDLPSGKSFYQAEYGIHGCWDAVSSGLLEAPYKYQVPKGDGHLNRFNDCYGINKAWPAGFPSEAIPGYCCRYQPYGTGSV